jgi:hypothetical protein
VNLPRSRSHIRLTNPRNKFKLKAKRKHNTTSEELRLVHEPWDGLSATHGRTVRGSRTDPPYLPIEPPETNLSLQTVRSGTTSCPSRHEGPSDRLGWTIRKHHQKPPENPGKNKPYSVDFPKFLKIFLWRTWANTTNTAPTRRTVCRARTDPKTSCSQSQLHLPTTNLQNC